MDLMSIRRGLLMQMASGAQFVKGAFTVPNDATSYTIEFGKTFGKYLFLIEMDDASKTVLMATGIDGNKPYALQGIYPIPSINNTVPSSIYVFQRVNPSTGAASSTSGSGFISTNPSLSSTQITLVCDAITATTSRAYRGYTYNYYIVEIK